MIDKSTKISLGLVGSIIASVVWLTTIAWGLERSVGERMHSIERREIRTEEQLSAVVDRLDIIATKLNAQTDIIPEMRVRIDMLQQRVSRLEE